MNSASHFTDTGALRSISNDKFAAKVGRGDNVSCKSLGSVLKANDILKQYLLNACYMEYIWSTYGVYMEYIWGRCGGGGSIGWR